MGRIKKPGLGLMGKAEYSTRIDIKGQPGHLTSRNYYSKGRKTGFPSLKISEKGKKVLFKTGKGGWETEIQ